MAAAGAIGVGLSAVSTVAGLSQQQRQARAQRDAIRAQNISARDQARLMEQRLEASEQTAQQMYMRERVLLDRQRDSANLGLEQQRLTLALQERQQGLSLSQAESAADQRMQQLLSAAAQTETEGSLANVETFRQLAQILTGNRDTANELTNMQAVSGLRGGTFDRLTRETQLNDIRALQAADTTADTNTRVSNINAENLRMQADLENNVQGVMLDLYRGQLERQRQLNDFTMQRMPGILDLQFRRNEAALEANRASQTASLSLQQEANQINLANTIRANNAQPVQGANILGGLASIGGSVFNLIQQQQPRTVAPGGSPTLSGDPININTFPTLFQNPVMQTRTGLLDGRL